MNSGTRLLIVAGGPGHPRHMLDYEIMAEVIKANYEIEHVDVLLCGGEVRACDFGNPYLSSQNLPIKYFREEKICKSCIRASVASSEGFTENILYLGQFIDSDSSKRISDFISDLINNTRQMSCNDFIKLKYRDIEIGKNAYETYQRSKYVGKIDAISLNEDKYIIELLKSACTYVEASYNLFSGNKYRVILQNEFSYLWWGVFGQAAFRYQIPVVQIFFKGHPHLPQLFVRKTFKDLMVDPFWNDALIQDYRIATSDQEIGAAVRAIKESNENSRSKEITQYYGESFVKDSVHLDEAVKNALSGSKPNVVVFCHLNWDASLSYGTRIFDFFEDWINFTFSEALKNRSVNWYFKIHPVESLMKRKGFWNEKYNTKTLVENKLKEAENCDHIFIIDGQVPTDQIQKFISVAVTSGGSIAYQLPAFGIPVINVNFGMHSDFGFTIDVRSENEYRQILAAAAQIDPVTDSQKNKALLYEYYYLHPDQYIDTSSLIYKDDDQNVLKQSVDKEQLVGLVAKVAGKKYCVLN